MESMPVDQIECMHDLTGQGQYNGVAIANLVRLIANKYETQGEHCPQSKHLSGPRWGLLLRLLAEEKRGNQRITPTYLSRCQSVSKNTISSLLRGLEDQGLIARELDEDDRRIFWITLTPYGRALIHDTAPARVERMNRLIGLLSPEEQDQLSSLLTRLYRSIIETSQPTEDE